MLDAGVTVYLGFQINLSPKPKPTFYGLKRKIYAKNMCPFEFLVYDFCV